MNGRFVPLTLGIAKGSEPIAIFREAASAFLKSTGRDCKIKAGNLVIDPQYQFVYSCKKK